jgi:hypothetical protein
MDWRDNFIEAVSKSKKKKKDSIDHTHDTGCKGDVEKDLKTDDDNDPEDTETEDSGGGDTTEVSET